MPDDQDDDRRNGGSVPRTPGDFLAQLRAISEQLASASGLSGLTAMGEKMGENLPGAAALRALASLPPMPPTPGALSAAQLRAIADGIAAQRQSIDALRAQLGVFDDQLAILQQILAPLVDWSSKWADLEKTVTRLGRDAPGAPAP